MSSPIFSAPQSLYQDVAQCFSGIYNVAELEFPSPPVILDIGANVGAFCIWAAKRWGGIIHAYEPNPDCIPVLQRNISQLENVVVNQVAVSDHDGREILSRGTNNWGECSIEDFGHIEDRGWEVDVIAASTLPPADFIKIDCEGSEWKIIRSYSHWDQVKAVAFEWHRIEERDLIAAFLTEKGFKCLDDQKTPDPNLGLQKWVSPAVPYPKGVKAASINILIACPCYGGVTYATHNQSVMNLVLELCKANVKHELHYLPNESLIPRARNRFGTMMLEGNFTHLLFLDVDIGFNARDIISLIALDKDIIALPYSAKDFDWAKIVKAVQKGITDPEVLRHCAGRPIINAHEDTKFEVTEAVQFPQLGTGILLSKRKVFEKMAEDPERKYKLMNNEAGSLKNDYAYEFFRCGINPKTRYFDSEDYRYCLDAKELGFETWLWPNCVTTHTGSYAFYMDIGTQAALDIDLTAPVKASEPPICTK